PVLPRLLFVFLDGVGLGPATDANPLATNPLPAFARLGGGHAWTDATPRRSDPRHLVRPIDANLGLDGLPQSGTGQASLFTGVNCAERAGRHYGPYPHSTSKPVLKERNLFAQLHEALGTPQPVDTTCAFANAYPTRFFEVMRERKRWTVTSYCCYASGVRLRRASDLERRRAVFADLTGTSWPGATLPVRSEAEAAADLLALAASRHVTLFEFWLTDKVGHAQDPERAAAILTSLDRFFGPLLDGLPDDVTLVVSSDHGNIEDLATKSHTRHPVPLIAVGPGATALADVDDLCGVVPSLVRWFESDRAAPQA
ncbi:MAG: alkaline phosphatase family protein, partial [Bacteroidota bacterium]